MPLQISELLQPIAGASPGGSDIRYEPIFDQIKRARVEEDDLPSGDWSRVRKTADHSLVIKLATEVLSTRSKDLQVAAWLTESLLKREGLHGLKSGIDLITSLLGQHWEHLFPEIEDDDLEMRTAPLDWVGQYLVVPVLRTSVNRSNHDLLLYRESRTVGYEADADTHEKQEQRREVLAAGKLSAEDFDEAFTSTPKAWYKELVRDIDATVGSVDTLDRTAQGKFGHAAPRFAPLRDALQQVRQVTTQLLAKKLELDPDPPEVVAAEEAAADAASPAGGLSPTPRSRADAESRIAAAARYMRAENSLDPAPYLLLRGFRWGELRADGQHVDPKLLAAPPTELRTRLRGLLLDARWAELLEAGEDVMASPFGRGWLDLQRYILAACGGLGSSHDQVAACIQGALRALLRDVPQLPALALMDDTPTANAETQAWLRDQNLGADDDALAQPMAVAPRIEASATGRALLERAQQRVRAGEPEKAIELLINPNVQDRSARDRFLRRSQAVRIMVDIGRDAVAQPILEDLVQEIEQHNLEQWEAADIVAQPLGLLYRCVVKSQPESPETQTLYLRICRLDPMLAIQIVGKPGS
ncbi:MAG: type VI secretion system protein TssA [Longimicrobiales bacterium]